MHPSLRIVAAALLAAPLLAATPAMAQLVDRAWIAGEGSDSGNCNVYLPCSSLAYAATQTAPGGAIVVLDSADYGPVTITQPVTIRSEGGNLGVVGAIDINAGPADRVVITGLDMEGTSPTVSYAYAIKVDQASDVLIENCQIKDYAGPSGTGAAVYINSASPTRVTIRNSTLYNSNIGVVVTSTGAAGAGHLKLFGSLLLANPTAGVRVIGSTSDAMFYGDQIIGSALALDLQQGAIGRSYGGNIITSGSAAIAMPLN